MSYTEPSLDQPVVTVLDTHDLLVRLVRKTPANRWAKPPVQKVRVYVSGQRPPDLERPPVTLKGDDLEVDAAWRRYNRAELRIMREVIAYAADELGDLARNVGLTGQLRFSRKAGCSCGCSPGFLTTVGRTYDVSIQKEG